MSRITKFLFFAVSILFFVSVIAAFYFFLAGSPLRAAEATKIKAKPKTKKMEQSALNFVQTVLNDPLFPDAYRGAKLSINKNHSTAFANIPKLRVLEYDIVLSQKSPFSQSNSCTIFTKESGETNFLLFFSNNDVTELRKEPDWEKLVLQWDAFVTRHWHHISGLKRYDDWRKAKRDYKPGRGIFTLRYFADNAQGVVTAGITLDIRLADGRIGGLSAPTNQPLKPLPPAPTPPSKNQIFSAVLASLPAFRFSMLKTDTLRSVSNLRAVSMQRFYSRLNAGLPNEKFAYNYQLDLRGNLADGKTIGIYASYDENAKQAKINAVFAVPVEEQSLVSRPFTIVVDSSPLWTFGGKGLSFVTTRDVYGRPWWQRDSILLSIASRLEDEILPKGLSVVRPIKQQGNDFIGYGQPLPSPTMRYLAATQGSRDNELFFLDLQQGRIYFPEPKGLTKYAAQQISPEEINPPLRLEIAGADWLPDEHGLILSLTNKDRDPNLYVARWSKGQPPREIELIPIVLELGTDVLPRLGRDGQTLAWARKIYKRERDKLPDEKDQWQLLVADFAPDNLVTRALEPKPGEILYATEAIAKLNTRNRRTLELPDEPLSIAWDEKNTRWLIVTRTKVLWVREVEGQLQSESAPELKWKDIALKPTSADVSRDGKIAIAAELATPQVYPKSECVVRSLIFGWDGQSTSVQPLYEPSLNGIPRYVFPATKSTWARIEGDAKRLGLEGLADPASFVSASAPAAP